MLKAERERALTPAERESILATRAGYAKDFRAYCEERILIPDRDSPTGAQTIPFMWNDCQLGLDHTIKLVQKFNILRSRILQQSNPRAPVSPYPIKIVANKARKNGVSTYLEVRADWLCEFVPGVNAVIMAHQREASQNIAEIARRCHYQFREDDLPIRQHAPRKGERGIEWGPDHGSKLLIKTAGSRGGSSRSFTYHFVHISEEAHFERPDEAASMLNAAVYHSERYRESTANGYGNSFHTCFEAAIWVEEGIDMLLRGEPFPEGWNGYFRFFWPWTKDLAYRLPLLPGEEDQIKNTLDHREKLLIEQHACDLEQLKWRRYKIADECANQSAMPPDDYFMQEYPASWEESFVTKGNVVFDQKRLSDQATAAQHSKPALAQIEWVSENDFREHAVGSERGATFWRFAEPAKGAYYVAGVDTSRGLAHGDWSVISIFDRTDGIQLIEVARYIGKMTGTHLSDLASWLAVQYNKSFLMPENNPPGNAVCVALAQRRYPYVYQAKNPEMIGDRGEVTQFLLGFNVNERTKALMVDVGVKTHRAGLLVLRNREAIRQWRMYKNEDGEYKAPDGEHDDCVMADLLAAYAHFTPGIAPIIDLQPSLVKDDGSEAPLEEELMAVIKRSRQNWSDKNLREEIRRSITSRRVRYSPTNRY